MTFSRPEQRETVPDPAMLPLRVLSAAVTVVLSSILIAAMLVGYLASPLDSVPRAPTATPVGLTLAGEELKIPLNMIRFADQRAGGTVDRVDLAVHWPSISGYREDLDQAFNDVSEESSILFVSLLATETPLDSTGRLASIYLNSFLEDELSAPEGLVARRLDPDDGYHNEIVYFEAGSTRPFVARCADGDDADIPPDCLREINLPGGLTIAYRFRRNLLGAWRELDAAIFTLAAQFRT